MRIAAITMQRNEDHCLEPWIRHHGYLFGFENLVVIDHGSDSVLCRDVLNRYRNFGLNVVDLPLSARFDDKGIFVYNEYARINTDCRFDFFFPIDCDEMLFLKGEDGRVVTSRDAIFDYINQFRNYGGRLFIKENYLRILGHPGYYWPQPYQKVFFASGACLGLDHGFHFGKALNNAESLDTNLIYAHFHFKPYDVNRKLSIEKLSDYVDVNDLDAFKSYDGPGFHLKSHVLATRGEYESLFVLNDAARGVPEIDNHLGLIGIDPEFCDGDAVSDARSVGPLSSRCRFASVTVSVSRAGAANGFTTFGLSCRNFAASGPEANPASRALSDAEMTIDLGEPIGISEVRLRRSSGFIEGQKGAADVAIDVGFTDDGLTEVVRRSMEGPQKDKAEVVVMFKLGIPLPGRLLRVRTRASWDSDFDAIEIVGESLPAALRAAFGLP